MKVQVFKKKVWTHEGPTIQKKERKKYSPCPKKQNGERWFMKGGYTPSTQNWNIHTHAHLDQGLWLVSPLDPVFDLATNKEQVCLRLFPDPELHISLFRGRWKRRQHFFLGEEFKRQKERFERTNWGARLCLISKIHKTQVSKHGRLRNLKFKPF